MPTATAPATGTQHGAVQTPDGSRYVWTITGRQSGYRTLEIDGVRPRTAEPRAAWIDLPGRVVQLDRGPWSPSDLRALAAALEDVTP